MGGLSSLTFTAPWLLLALAILPVLWWLLRLLPPAPRRLAFPAIRLLFDLKPREETPDRTPPWLILLRILLAGLVILALAQPLLTALGGSGGSGPLLLVIDDGWAAAPHWPLRLKAIEDRLAEAERSGRPVALLTTAPRAGGPLAVSGPMSAGEARRLARIMAPQPWPTDRAAALQAIEAQPWPDGATVIWIADGVAAGPVGLAGRLAERLQRLGSLTVLHESPQRLALLQLPPASDQDGATLRPRRADGARAPTVAVRALGDDRPLRSRPAV